VAARPGLRFEFLGVPLEGATAWVVFLGGWFVLGWLIGASASAAILAGLWVVKKEVEKKAAEIKAGLGKSEEDDDNGGSGGNGEDDNGEDDNGEDDNGDDDEDQWSRRSPTGPDWDVGRPPGTSPGRPIREQPPVIYDPSPLQGTLVAREVGTSRVQADTGNLRRPVTDTPGVQRGPTVKKR